ncbi:MAG: hypothetical protein LOD91_07720 [Limnochordales bacterium]
MLKHPERVRVGAALLALLAVIGLYAFFQSPFFAITEVRVVGAARLAPETLIERAQVRLGDNVLHVDLQLVAAGQKITCDIPIKFIGREKLKSKGLILQVNIDSINVTGEATVIPEHFVVDVGDKNNGDVVTIEDLNIHPEIQITDLPEDAIAVITSAEEETSEEGEESETASS